MITILIQLLLALFILPIYCTLWITGTARFSGFQLWKMNLSSHYFINCSLTFLFIVYHAYYIIVIIVVVNASYIIFIYHVLFFVTFILAIIITNIIIIIINIYLGMQFNYIQYDQKLKQLVIVLQ